MVRSSKALEDSDKESKVREMERNRREKEKQMLRQKELEVRKFKQEQKMQSLERKARTFSCTLGSVVVDVSETGRLNWKHQVSLQVMIMTFQMPLYHLHLSFSRRFVPGTMPLAT